MDEKIFAIQAARDTGRIKCEMEQANRFLDVIANELGSINKKLERFLKPDDDLARQIAAFPLPERTSFPPSNPYCSWCMAEIGYHDKKHICRHATLCMACAPCDECLVEEG